MALVDFLLQIYRDEIIYEEVSRESTPSQFAQTSQRPK